MSYAPEAAGVVPHDSHAWRNGRCTRCHVSKRWPIAAQVCTRRYHVERPTKPRWQNATTAERVARALRMIDAGTAQRAAARAVSLDVKTVRRYLRLRAAEEAARTPHEGDTTP